MVENALVPNGFHESPKLTGKSNGAAARAANDAPTGAPNGAAVKPVVYNHYVTNDIFKKSQGMCGVRGVRVEDEWTHLCGLWLRNRHLVVTFALGQLIVALVSFAQHVYSVSEFNKIFLCSFNSSNADAAEFLSQDVIIFDFGLFHELISVQECIANYLDGGYMRCLWCIGQSIALVITLFTCLCVRHPHPLLLWPILIMQNAYCFGLVILTIATADKLLVSILHPVNPHLNLLIFYFGVGTSINHLFDYILWHYYWHEEFQYITRTGKHVIPFWV